MEEIILDSVSDDAKGLKTVGNILEPSKVAVTTFWDRKRPDFYFKFVAGGAGSASVKAPGAVVSEIYENKYLRQNQVGIKSDLNAKVEKNNNAFTFSNSNTASQS